MENRPYSIRRLNLDVERLQPGDVVALNCHGVFPVAIAAGDIEGHDRVSALCRDFKATMKYFGALGKVDNFYELPIYVFGDPVGDMLQYATSSRAQIRAAYRFLDHEDRPITAAWVLERVFNIEFCGVPFPAKSPVEGEVLRE